MDSLKLPSFEELPPLAQERIGAIAREFRLERRHALIAVLLLARGISAKAISDSCRKAGVPLTMKQVREIRERVEGWVSLEDRRKAIATALEKQGLLTEERQARLTAATTGAALSAIYFEAVPTELRRVDPAVAEQWEREGTQTWDAFLNGVDVFDLLRYAGSGYDAVAEAVSSIWDGLADGVGDVAGNALSSIWDAIDF